MYEIKRKESSPHRFNHARHFAHWVKKQHRENGRSIILHDPKDKEIITLDDEGGIVVFNADHDEPIVYRSVSDIEGYAKDSFSRLEILPKGAKVVITLEQQFTG